MANTDNPLLAHGDLPRFDEITPNDVEPAIRQILTQGESDLATAESALEPSWTGTMEALRSVTEPLAFAWGTVNHLMGVQNSPALREAHQAVQPEVVAFSLRLGQSRPVYEALNHLRASDDWDRLDEAQRRIAEASLLQAELAGVALDGAEKDRFVAVQTELAELGTQFSNHLLDATKAFALVLTSPSDVEGLPNSLREAAAAQAQTAGDAESCTAENGPWRMTLDAPVFIPFMEHCHNRDLREQLYRAFITRASNGAYDNTALIDRILELRYEKGRLLGYETPADLSLASKMAPDVEAVDALSLRLREVARPHAQRDLDELQAYARAETGDTTYTIRHWDVAFWAERNREARFAFNDEMLRPYFSFDRVLTGMFELAERLFGINITAADDDTTVWHPDVRFFRIADSAGEQISSFYLDPFSRPADKRGGAWMGECLNRTERPDGRITRPVAYLVCNQTPPVGDKPSLMTFDEVRTLFHEFGHGLQHMLTTVRYPEAAGINNVEWDAIELPSQFMENWCYHQATLRGLSSHYETGAPLPDELFEKILAARTYRSGSQTLRQLYFGMLDMELHHRYQPAGSETVLDIVERVSRDATILRPLPEDRFLCGFQHIFAGGYAAGYYSYKWAEVLSADAFSAFEEAGLDDPSAVAETGHRFRDTVLALGGGRDPMTVFHDFRGREPSTDALLRHCGLADAGCSH